MTVTVPRLLLWAAAACFLIAVLVATAAVTFTTDWSAWLAGGLLAWVFSLILATEAPPVQ